MAIWLKRVKTKVWANDFFSNPLKLKNKIVLLKRTISYCRRSCRLPLVNSALFIYVLSISLNFQLCVFIIVAFLISFRFRHVQPILHADCACTVKKNNKKICQAKFFGRCVFFLFRLLALSFSITGTTKKYWFRVSHCQFHYENVCSSRNKAPTHKQIGRSTNEKAVNINKFESSNIFFTNTHS